MEKTSYALITGASSGIGEACARALGALGKPLALVARRKDRLEDLKTELEAAHGIDVLVLPADVRRMAQVDAVFRKLQGKRIDVVVNNAGLARGKASLEEAVWEDIEDMVETNVKGFVRVAQLAIPFLKETKGHVINVSSIAGAEAYPGGGVYCGTKAFVTMFSKTMRMDLLGTGIRVTDIAPGAVETDFSRVRFHGDNAKAKAVYDGFIPLGAKDIADCVLFALSQPRHVNVEYLLVTPTAQASVHLIDRGE